MFQTGDVTWPPSLSRNHELNNLDGTKKDVDNQRLNQSSEVRLILLGRVKRRNVWRGGYLSFILGF